MTDYYLVLVTMGNIIHIIDSINKNDVVAKHFVNEKSKNDIIKQVNSQLPNDEKAVKIELLQKDLKKPFNSENNPDLMTHLNNGKKILFNMNPVECYVTSIYSKKSIDNQKQQNHEL